MIETTEFAQVNIAVSPAGVSTGNFGILGFLTNETGVISTAERSRAYTSLAGVGGDWAADTEVYAAATAFYAQTPTPTDFVVLMCFETDQPATLVGGDSFTYDEFIGITAGNFNITVDGTAVAIADLDLSGVTSAAGIDGVATALEDAITSANSTPLCSVTHNGYSFVLESLVDGAASTVTFAEGETGAGTQDAAEAFGFTQNLGKISVGLDAETPLDALAAVASYGTEFVALDLHRKYRDNVSDEGAKTAEIASWCEASQKIFMNTTNNLATLSSAITTDVASLLKAMTLRFTLTTFSKSVKQYPSASVFGRAASVNFDGVSTTITLNLKQMPTITVEDLSPAEFGVLRSKNASAVVRIGKSVNAFTDSKMASGSWLDTTHGLLWLENRCEVDMFNLLYQTTTKIPATQDGVNSAYATLDRSLQAAVQNGLCAPGFLPSGEFLPAGYRITAAPLSVSPIQNRKYSGLSFEMVGAGALQDVEVSGSFSE